MKFPRFSRQDRLWMWYVLIILGIYIIGALLWQSISLDFARGTVSGLLIGSRIAVIT